VSHSPGRYSDTVEPPEVTQRILASASADFLGDLNRAAAGDAPQGSIITEGGLEVMLEGRALSNKRIGELLEKIDRYKAVRKRAEAAVADAFESLECNL